MTARSKLLNRLLVAIGTCVIWEATAGQALAQASAEEGSGPSYGLSWGLAILCVALGVFVTVRPSGRKLEVKRPKKEA